MSGEKDLREETESRVRVFQALVRAGNPTSTQGEKTKLENFVEADEKRKQKGS